MEYQRYDFCRDIECLSFEFGACQNAECLHTAKEFHKWLVAEGFKISKPALQQQNEGGLANTIRHRQMLAGEYAVCEHLTKLGF